MEPDRRGECEIAGANGGARRDESGALDDVLELAHVAGPRVGQELFLCGGRETQRSVVPPARLLEEPFPQELDVLRARTERGHIDSKARESKDGAVRRAAKHGLELLAQDDAER